MELELRDRGALVTAASRGIGLAIAAALAAEGVRVVIAARDEAVLAAASERVGATGWVSADLATETGCEAAFDEARRQLGRVDILVNNYGGRAGSDWTNTTAREYIDAFATNVVPAVRLSQMALPEMVAAGWGRIVVVTSVWGREAGGAPAYNAAKAAEHSFVTALAREVGASGITVNAVAPGSILWEGGSWDRAQRANPERIAEFIRREMPLGRFGSAEEVANVVTFLCSPRASLVNGSAVSVDGGQSRSNT